MSGIKRLIEDNIINDSYEKGKRIREDYRLQHCCCPECGSQSNTQTLLGFVVNVDEPESYVDHNNVYCRDCDWKGIVHDLVPE